MSLQKKIILNFLISTSIIALLVSFQWLTFARMRRQISFLELTDTIRSKSLQLRRHEKNFFLYDPFGSSAEPAEIRRYLAELEQIASGNIPDNGNAGLLRLVNLIREYRRRFELVESQLETLHVRFSEAVALTPATGRYLPVLSEVFVERPIKVADSLEQVFGFSADHPLVKGLRAVEGEIAHLRRTGADILVLSKELDRTARNQVDRYIHLSQVAMVILFPLFLVVGTVALLFVVRNIVLRLNALGDIVERTGRGDFSYPARLLEKFSSGDEVGLLVGKFFEMGDKLTERDRQLASKNEELLQSRKLAAIGTLASGVAHEINNPLNNIHLAAQVLARETGEACPDYVSRAVDDILGQTARVKRIVADLLEFARDRELDLRSVEFNDYLQGVVGLLTRNAEAWEASSVNLQLRKAPEAVLVRLDREKMEQVFINLFANAVEAMRGEGDFSLAVFAQPDKVAVTVSDTGPGIPEADREKIFEPFYTTKEKGTGLGLAIVFNLARKHGGEIAVDSGPERGTIFTITLPRENGSWPSTS